MPDTTERASRLSSILREQLGQHVRREWLEFVIERPGPVKDSWVEPWDQMAEPGREVDRRIGVALFNRGFGARDGEVASLLTELERHRFELLDALGIVGAEEDTDPYDAVRGLHAEIDRLRGALAEAAGRVR
jgi:hypothetical protein